MAWKSHLRPSLLVSVLDIDLRACGALRSVAVAHLMGNGHIQLLLELYANFHMQLRDPWAL